MQVRFHTSGPHAALEGSLERQVRGAARCLHCNSKSRAIAGLEEERVQLSVGIRSSGGWMFYRYVWSVEKGGYGRAELERLVQSLCNLISYQSVIEIAPVSKSRGHNKHVPQSRDLSSFSSRSQAPAWTCLPGILRTGRWTGKTF